MRRFEKLLVPLDGSHLAEAALPAATVLAQRFKATVSLLHVLERGAPETVHGEPHLVDARQAQRYLEKVADQCGCLGVAVELHVHPNLERDVVGSIINHSREFGADLIILSTHGWGGMRDLLVGSIAQQVLRRGTLPVLLVKPTSTGTPPPFEGRRVLVPLDGTQAHDGAVLPVVEALARALDSTVHLMLAVPTVGTVPGNYAAVARLTPSATAAALDMEQEAARAYLESIAGRLISGHVSTGVEVRRGDPADCVVEAAASMGADLIVMSTHARAGLEALWSASVGSKILSRIQQPLLLVRVTE